MIILNFSGLKINIDTHKSMLIIILVIIYFFDLVSMEKTNDNTGNNRYIHNNRINDNNGLILIGEILLNINKTIINI